MASASIDADPVIAKPMNLTIAMPMLASSAATTAFDPCPPPAMRARYGARHQARFPARIETMTFPELVAADPDAPAVDDLSRQRTRGELFDRALRLGHWMLDDG